MRALILLPAEREFPEPDLRTKWFYDFGFMILVFYTIRYTKPYCNLIGTTTLYNTKKQTVTEHVVVTICFFCGYFNDSVADSYWWLPASASSYQ
ncbi:MAG: hypothetical protein ACTH1Q_09295 [Levilactobacillus brevis]